MNKHNKILCALAIFIGIIFLVDFIFLIAIGSVLNIGILFPLVAGIILIAGGVLKLRSKKTFLHIRNPLVIKTIKLVLFMMLASFIVIESFIISSLKSDNTTDIDYAIILGAGLKGDKMTLTFRNRVDRAIEYLNENPSLLQNPEFKIIVTGGQGPGETITEAEAMKRYIVEKGISEDKIIKEDKSTSTMENFKYSKKLLKSSQDKLKIMIFTSDFHMFRSKMLARRNGFEAYGITSETWWAILPNSVVREYLAVIKSFFLDVNHI